MGDKQSIHGIQVGLNVDMILFTPKTIEKDKDVNTLKENVGKISKDIKTMLEERYQITELDDIVTELTYVNYIDDTNINEYIEVDIIE